MGVFSASLTWHSKQVLAGGGPLWISLLGNVGAAFKNSLTTSIVTTTPITAITRKKFICPLFFFFAIENKLGGTASYCINFNLGSLGESSHLHTSARWFVF